MKTPLEDALDRVVPAAPDNRDNFFVRSEMIMGVAKISAGCLSWNHILNDVGITSEIRDTLGLPRAAMPYSVENVIFHLLVLISSEIPHQREKQAITRIMANIHARLEQRGFFLKQENPTLTKFITTLR